MGAKPIFCAAFVKKRAAEAPARPIVVLEHKTVSVRMPAGAARGAGRETRIESSGDCLSYVFDCIVKALDAFSRIHRNHSGVEAQLVVKRGPVHFFMAQRPQNPLFFCEFVFFKNFFQSFPVLTFFWINCFRLPHYTIDLRICQHIQKNT